MDHMHIAMQPMQILSRKTKFYRVFLFCDKFKCVFSKPLFFEFAPSRPRRLIFFIDHENGISCKNDRSINPVTTISGV